MITQELYDHIKNLSLEQQSKFYRARIRRSLKRGESKQVIKIRKHIQTKQKYKLQNRSLIILPNMVGKTVFVYNGQKYTELSINYAMCGHYIGQYIRTRKPVKHGKAGVGASRGTKYVPIK